MENGVNGTGTHQHENGEQVEGLYRVSVLFGVDDGMLCVCVCVCVCVCGRLERRLMPGTAVWGRGLKHRLSR